MRATAQRSAPRQRCNRKRRVNAVATARTRRWFLSTTGIHENFPTLAEAERPAPHRCTEGIQSAERRKPGRLCAANAPVRELPASKQLLGYAAVDILPECLPLIPI